MKLYINNLRKVRSLLVSSIAVSYLVPVVTFAQTTLPPFIPRGFGSPEQGVEKLVVRIGYFFGFAILAIAVIMILIAAFNFLTGGGNEEKITAARNYLIYALVGVGVALLAFWLPTVVGNVIGT